MSKRQFGACISGFALQQMAIEMDSKVYSNTGDTVLEFKASNGYLHNCLSRKNLVLRRITTKGVETPKNEIPITVRPPFCEPLICDFSIFESIIISQMKGNPLNSLSIL